MTISCDGIHQEATFKGYTSCPSIGRAKNSARYWADARYGAPSQFTLDQFKGIPRSANRLSATMFAMRRYSANNIGLGNTVHRLLSIK